MTLRHSGEQAVPPMAALTKELLVATVPLNRGSRLTLQLPIHSGFAYLDRDNRQFGFRSQPKDFLTPLPYKRFGFKVTSFHSYTTKWGQPRLGTVCSWLDNAGLYMVQDQSSVLRPWLITVKNRAYEKFIEKVHKERAEIGTATVEARKSLDMIADRCAWLARSYKLLRKGRFRDFSRSLGVKPLPKHRETRWSRPQDAAGLWLEYWMGWAPTVADIHNAVKVVMIDRYPEDIPVRAGSSTSVTLTQKINDTLGYDNSYITGKVSCHITADVRVTNPNLAMAGELGLLNPLSIAWQTIPFSFLVDWFGNIGQVLSSFSDLVGYEVKHASHTFSGKLEMVRQGIINAENSPTDATLYCQCSATSSPMVRIMGLPSPVLQFRFPEQLSITRAATSISLLVALFTERGKK